MPNTPFLKQALPCHKSSEISPAFIADKFVRQIQEMQDADILFMISKADLKKNETSATDVVNLVKKIKELKEVKELKELKCL